MRVWAETVRDFLNFSHRACEARDERCRDLAHRASEICLKRLETLANPPGRVLEISVQSPQEPFVEAREDYMVDHYNETVASPGWLALPDEVKRQMLDMELDHIARRPH